MSRSIFLQISKVGSFCSVDKCSLELEYTEDQRLNCSLPPPPTKVTMSLIHCQLMPGVSPPSIKFFKTVAV